MRVEYDPTRSQLEEEHVMEARFESSRVEARRQWLVGAAALAGVGFLGCKSRGDREEREHEDEHEGEGEAEVTPGEDLMQEHGVLERVLLVYAESARRIDGGDALDPAVVRDAAEIVRDFVEAYHERNEEDFVFPRLESARREVELVRVLRRQHERGRAVTADILRLAKESTASPELSKALRAFERMYRPHAAREDTVLFPAFRAVIGKKGYAELGEQFEDREHERFGEHGFEDVVARVARLETKLGIADLASFTP